MIAQVVVNSKTGRKNPYFSYLVPTELEQTVRPGQLVQVFFRGRKTNGLIWQLEDGSHFQGKKLLPILSILDLQPIPNYLFELINWVSDYYFSPLPTTAFNLLPDPVKLNGQVDGKAKDQKNNGKSQVYTLNAKKNMRLLAYKDILKLAHKKGKRVIIIFPTINEAEDFYASLAEKNGVKLIHSKIPKGEKYRIFRSAQSGSFSLIATRIGLSYPIENLSYYIIDSPSALSYTADMTPRYQTGEVVLKLADLRNVNVILGSSIPRLKEYLQFKEGMVQEIQSPSFISPFKSLDILIHNADETKGKLDYGLQTEINRALSKGWRVTLFTDRFDSNQVLFCPDCGKVFTCLQCHNQLTYKNEYLVCKNCHYEREPIRKCDECHNTRLIPLGFDRKRMEKNLTALFPQANIKAIGEEGWEKSNILLTDNQLYQYPDYVTDLLIILDTDRMLLSSHYDNDETVFGQLAELANLARHRFILKTQHSQNPVLQFFGQKNLHGFLDYLAENRKQYGLPPAKKLLKIYLADKEEEKANQKAEEIYSLLEKVKEEKLDNIKVYEPLPRAHYKEGQRFWMQILVKFSEEREREEIYQILPNEVSVEIEE